MYIPAKHFDQSHFNKNYVVDLHALSKTWLHTEYKKTHQKQTWLWLNNECVLSFYCWVLHKESWWHRARAASWKPKAWSSMVTTWICDHHVLCFVPTLRSLWSQILCRLYGRLVNRGPLCLYTCKRSHIYIKDHIVHVRVWWIMETQKRTQHALKVSKSLKCWSWTLYGGRRRSLQRLFFVGTLMDSYLSSKTARPHR